MNYEFDDPRTLLKVANVSLLLAYLAIMLLAYLAIKLSCSSVQPQRLTINTFIVRSA